LSPTTGRLHRHRTLRERLAVIYEVSGTAERIASMEGLRGLAVLLVFFVHFHALFRIYVDRESLSYACSRFLSVTGHSGVDLFFVISGYLIYGAVLDRRIQYGRFLRRRVQRIYPTFLSVLGLYVVLSVLFPWKSKIPSGHLNAVLYVLANAALLPGILPIEPMMSVAWTLSYEFFFYLTIPIFVAIWGLRERSRLARMVFLSGCTAVFLASSMLSWVGHSRLALFLIGALLYDVVRSEGLKARLNRLGEICSVLVFVLGMVAIYVVTTQLQLSIPMRSVIRVVILCVSLFGFTLFCVAFNGLLRRMFCWTPIRWLGNMSYSYYLLHSLTLQAVVLGLSRLITPEPYPILFWAMMPVSLSATLVSSTILFLLVEKPFSLQPPGTRAKLRAEYPEVAGATQGGTGAHGG